MNALSFNGELADALYGSPRPLPCASLRERVEQIVECLIDLLDAIDGDTDAEPGTDDDMCRAEDEPPCNHLLGPGDDTDAEPEIDLGAAEDEGVACFPPMRLSRIGCSAFDGI